jgi:hypothetical protein
MDLDCLARPEAIKHTLKPLDRHRLPRRRPRCRDASYPPRDLEHGIRAAANRRQRLANDTPE